MRLSTILLLLATAVSSATVSARIDFDNASLRRAVADYLEDSTAATQQYGAIEDWSTWKVTDTSRLFQGATSFTSDISEWDMSSVTTMHHMFAGATAFNAPLADWDTSQVVDFSFAFSKAESFEGQEIGSWNTEEALTMQQMFVSATSFVGSSRLQEWSVGHVTSMIGMFYGATQFNQPLDGWDVSNVRNMNSLVEGASSFNQQICWSQMNPQAKCFQCFCGTDEAGFAQNCKARVHPSVLAYSQACSTGDVLETSVENQVFERPTDFMGGFGAQGSFAESSGFDSPADNAGVATSNRPVGSGASNSTPATEDEEGDQIMVITANQREVSGAESMRSYFLFAMSMAAAATFLF